MVENMIMGTQEPDSHACDKCGWECHCERYEREAEEAELIAAILSCPACGETDDVAPVYDLRKLPRPNIIQCGCCGLMTDGEKTLAEAVRKWNRTKPTRVLVEGKK